MESITSNVKATVEKLIDNASTAIITTIDEDGFPNTRAMLAVRKRVDLKHFYFTTNTSSQKVKQLLNNPKSCIYIYDSSSFVGAMLIGNAEVLTDEESRKLIWQAGDEQYYSKGVNDPDYAVIKFTANKLRYYSDFNPLTFNVNG